MERYPHRREMYVEGRRRPLGYELQHPEAGTLFVAGHYETPCGGCDTITKGFDYIFELVRSQAALGHDVLFEGLLLGSDINRLIELHEAHAVVVVDLRTSLEECLVSVNARRWAKDPTKPPVKEGNTRSKYRLCQRYRPRLQRAGVDVRHLERAEAFEAVCGLLGMPAVAMKVA
jgi:hypothetical protein